MARQPSPPPDDSKLRQELGSEVQKLRKRLGLTQTELGDRVNYTQATISRLESGHKISAAILGHVLPVLAATPPEAARLRSLNEVNERGREQRNRELIKSAAPWLRKVLDLEPSATAILSWTGERIKGLLQAESYMVEQFRGHGVDDLAEAVTGRAARAVRAFTENPDCQYDFMISESAIERLVRYETTNKFVALDQLKHLRNLMDRHPGVSVRLVPFGPALHVDPDFTIMEFADFRPDFGYSEVPGSLATTEQGVLDPQVLRERWDRLRQSALTARQTHEFLENSLHRCHGSP